MFLGALVDAGVPLAVLQDAVTSLDLGAKLDLRRVDRSGIDSAKIDVLTAEGEIAEVAHAAAPAACSNHDHHHADAHGHSHDNDHPHEHAHADGTTHVHGRSLSAIEGIIRGSTLPVEVQAIALKAFNLLGRAEAKIHNVPVETIH